MDHNVPESDWKAFRKLRETALERFCKHVLDEADRFRADDSRSHHQRYRDLFSWLGERDLEMAATFDNPRHSTMVMQLAGIHRQGLLEPKELERFTAWTRQAIEPLTRAQGQ